MGDWVTYARVPHAQSITNGKQVTCQVTSVGRPLEPAFEYTCGTISSLSLLPIPYCPFICPMGIGT